MTIFTAVRTKMATTAGITAVVADRIFPVLASQNPARPLIVYELALSKSTALDHSQPSRGRLIVHCITNNFEDSITLAYLVKATLHAFNTAWGDIHIGHSICQSIEPRAEEIDSAVCIYATAVEFSLLYDGES